MKTTRLVFLTSLFVATPVVAQACAYHAVFSNLTFGNMVIMMLNYLQASTTNQIMLAMDGIRTGTSYTPLFVAMGFGFAYGSLHALGPGHGKLVISSYFLGRDGKVREGILMGAQIAAIHVASALVIVVAADFIFSTVFDAGTNDYRYVRLVSYGAIVGIGLYMFWLAAQKWKDTSKLAHKLGLNDGHHFHHHAHDHAHDHGHGGNCNCSLHETDENGETRRRSFISLIVGVVPCTGAILVMLFALANNATMIGVAVVIAISLGMAATMSSLGVISVWLRRSVLENLNDGGGAVTLSLEFLGAMLILSIGSTLFFFTV